MEFNVIFRAQPGCHADVRTRLLQAGFSTFTHGERIKILGTGEAESLQLHALALVLSREDMLKDIQITNTYRIGQEEEEHGRES